MIYRCSGIFGKVLLFYSTADNNKMRGIDERR
jgi:hypothetical protein